MVLRATKLVALPARAAETERLYHEFTQPFTRKCPGNVAVRLYRHIATPNTFFVHSWWRALEDIRLAECQPEYGQMHSRVRGFAIERLRTWELSTSHDLTDGMRVEPAGTEVLRTARVVAKPGETDALGRLYEQYSTAFTLRQPGCLGVRLMRHIDTPNTHFVQSYWRSRDDLEAALSQVDYTQLRAASLRLIIERIQTWDLSLLADDPELPLFALPGAGGHAGIPVGIG